MLSENMEVADLLDGKRVVRGPAQKGLDQVVLQRVPGQRGHTDVGLDASTKPHEPALFMGSPVDAAQMNCMGMDPRMDGILLVGASKGKGVLNRRRLAITATVKQGRLLRYSERLLELMLLVSGRLSAVSPISTGGTTHILERP